MTPIIIATIPDVISLLEQINFSLAPGMQLLICKIIFSPGLLIKYHHKQFAFDWPGQQHTITVIF